MGISDWFRRKKGDPEAERRARLLSRGRITDGSILDVGSDAEGLILQIYYRYTVSGVDYEASQVLDRAQQQRPVEYSPGARVVVRYDPRRP
ncbi:MAG TPA: DUF3592 domain-containing protein, partial [Pyrinomonadaceae bacterium]